MTENNINLETSEEMIKECLKDLYLEPRKSILKWSKRTNQTANARLGYPSQHLASVITGVKGVGTAARGDDLADKSEVKSCSRADQLSECRDCRAKVMVWEEKCPRCGSQNINIKTDSHWIISINSQDELNLYLDGIPRLILMLFDRKSQESDKIRLRAWTVDPKNEYYRGFLLDYFNNNFLKKQNPAPCNLHPLKYDFYMMEPKLIFNSKMDIKENKVEVIFWNLENPQEENMPSQLISKEKLLEIFGNEYSKKSKKEIVEYFPKIPKEKMGFLEMKEKKTKTYKNKYSRH